MEKKIVTDTDLFFDQKDIINNLAKLFSNPPSNNGYRHDVEMLLNELNINEKNYFRIVIKCLSKEMRNKDDLKVISSYLLFMQEFIKLIENKKTNKKESDFINDLINLSSSLYYLKIPKNYVLMRYGERGNKAYINLNGEVDILIKNSKTMKINEKDYLYYLATLIKYNEFTFINLVLNDNFFNFPLIIYDDIESKTKILSIIEDKNKNKIKKITTFIRGKNNEIKKITIDSNILFSKSKTSKQFIKRKSDIHESVIREYFNLEKADLEENQKYQSQNLKNAFKLNLKNEDLKTRIEPYIISSKQLLDLFGFTYLDEKDEELNNCSSEEYIKRLEIVSNKLESEIDKEKDEDKKIKELNESKDSTDSNESLKHLIIYSYTRVTSLGKGYLFGELALLDSQAVRTATIISSSQCHFVYFSKSTFNNWLIHTAKLNLNEQLSFFINLPIFNNIPATYFFKNYFTNISKHYITKNHYIIKQGEKPEQISFLYKGMFILIANLNLNDISNLIFFLLEKIKKYKNILMKIEKNDDNNEMFLSLKKNVEDEKKLIRDDMIFKNFYFTESLLKITEISCPDIIGYDELIGEDGLYSFSIQAKTNENIIYSMPLELYNELFSKNGTVQKRHEDLIAIKLDLILRRLLKIRNSTISSFFNHKIEKDIDSVISKELDDVKVEQRKFKRFIQFKNTKCNFNSKSENSSIIDIINNNKEFLKKRNIYYNFVQTNKKKIIEKMNILNIYKNSLLRNNSSDKKTYKNLILPKTKLVQKKNNLFLNIKTDYFKNKKEEKLNRTSYKYLRSEETKSKDKNITQNEDNSKEIRIINKKITNILPLFKSRKSLRTEYSLINDQKQKYYYESSYDIKGKKISDNIKIYFDKKIHPSKSVMSGIIKKRKKNKKINNRLKYAQSEVKKSYELFHNLYNDSYSYEKNDEKSRNNIEFSENLNFSTPKNLKFNLFLLNNKSLIFANKESHFQKSMKLLTQNNSNEIKKIKNVKDEEKEKDEDEDKDKEKYEDNDKDKKKDNKMKNHLRININNIKKDKIKIDYIFKRKNYYKKNLRRMKFFYGLLDKK